MFFSGLINGQKLVSKQKLGCLVNIEKNISMNTAYKEIPKIYCKLMSEKKHP